MRLSMSRMEECAHTRLGRALDAAPEPLRDVLATVYAAAIRPIRYGPGFSTFYRLLEHSQSFTDERVWRAQSARLAAVLYQAVSAIPYYAQLDIADDVRRLVREDPRGALGLFPLLDKETVHERGDDLQYRGRRYRPMETHTSGTTGTALRLAIGRAGLQRSYACLWHLFSWYGCGLDARVAMVAGHLVAAPERQRPPFWLTDLLGGERLFSPRHLSPTHARAYAGALVEFRPDVVAGYPSHLTSLAIFSVDQDLRLPRPAVVTTLGETLLPRQRELISAAFRAPVAAFYGNAERSAHILECPEGRLHVLPQVGVVEVQREDGRPASPGEEGELICTGLLDEHMPLIRYRIGDSGVPAAGDCPCGRRGTVLRSLTGRLLDVIVTPDGRRIGPVDNTFRHSHSIREAQIVQDRADAVVMRVVPREGCDERTLEMVKRELQSRLGPSMHIRLECVEEIERGPNGKLRLLVVDPSLQSGDAPREPESESS